MKNLISFVHISLDGFVAGPNGEMNWITLDDALFEHVENRIKRNQAALYGRVTFDMMEAYWPTAGDQPNASRHDKNHAAWYKQAHKVVMSKTLQNTGMSDRTIISDDLAEQIHLVKQQEGDEILLFGSPSATHALMKLGLIDGYWLFVNPIILGEGMPLFNGSVGRTPLTLSDTPKTFDCGVTELKYLVK